ncbi:MAG TPA: hypothetical protein VNU26_02270, partial [Mycobacteriales bacterium]|nr:hypothetical protein [Mycobacteriales bacterium]
MGARARPAAGGGRWVDVAPERLERWLAGFAERHGPTQQAAASDGGQVVVAAADGARAVPLGEAGQPPLEPLRCDVHPPAATGRRTCARTHGTTVGRARPAAGG